jgi:hypothetical protein
VSRWVIAAAVGLTLVSVTGCDGAQAGPTAALSRFTAAWSARDGAQLCGALAPQTAAEVAAAAKKPCAQGVLEEDLPPSGPVRAVHVWGRQAQARTATDTLFLSLLDDGWRITAAGCRPQGGGSPYDCQVQGG